MNGSILTVQLDFLTFSWRNGVETGVWRFSFFLGLCALTLTMLARLDLYWGAKALWGWALCCALYILEFPAPVLGPETEAFQALAGGNIAEVILIPLFALTIHRRNLEGLLKAFRWIGLFELVAIWVPMNGLMMAPSFNAALVALYLPFGPPWLWYLAVPTILTHHAGCAQVMLATYAILWGWRNLRRPEFVAGSLALLAILYAVVYTHSHAPLLDGQERLDRWFGRFMRFWLYGDLTGKTHDLNWIWLFFGVGPATFTWISMKIDRFQAPVAIFMHNDFLQIPWELGLTGLAFALITLQRAFRNVWGDSRVSYALAALMPFAFIWHPLRWFPSALLVALIFRLALVEAKKGARG